MQVCWGTNWLGLTEGGAQDDGRDITFPTARNPTVGELGETGKREGGLYKTNGKNITTGIERKGGKEKSFKRKKKMWGM